MFFMVADTILRTTFGIPWLIISLKPASKNFKQIKYFLYKNNIFINDYSLTAADGEGQQWRAAPACTASTELETKGSLAMSALTKLKFLATEISMRYKCKMIKRFVLNSFIN